MSTSESFEAIKIATLRKRRDELIEEYQALATSLGGYLDEGLKLQIKRGMEQKAAQIAQIDKEISELDQAVAWPIDTDHLVVRVVVVAMCKEQADALDSGQAFAGSQDYQHYDDLRKALQAHGVGQLAQHYGPAPDDWSPFIGTPGETIAQLVEETAKRLNADNARQAGWRPVEVKPLSCECLSNDPGKQIQSWEEVERQGGIVIVDAVSLHHPNVRQYLQNGQVMGANSNAAMIVLSPLKADTLPVNNLLRTRLYQAHLARAFSHFQTKLNPLWEFGVNDLCNLQRWLYATLPKMRMDGLPPATKQAAETFYRPAGVKEPILGGARR